MASGGKGSLGNQNLRVQQIGHQEKNKMENREEFWIWLPVKSNRRYWDHR